MTVGLQRILIPSVLVFGCQISETFAGNSSALVLGKIRHIPSLTEIFLPPLILLALCTLGICFLLVCRVQKFVRKLQSRKRVDNVDFEIYHIETFSNDKRKTKTFKNSKTSNDLAFLSQFDLEVLNFLQHFSNKPIELLKIGTPALITIILGPFAILFYHSTTEFFWPKETFPELPNNNQCISCFLTPAGLVYAISFGFAFSSALGKQSEILSKVTEEISFIDQAATLTSKLKLTDHKIRMDIYQAIKCEAIYMILQIENRKASIFTHKSIVDVKTAIWKILDLLQGEDNPDAHHIDDVMKRHLIDYISRLNNICSDDLSVLHSRTHWLMWVFLISLGFFSLYGVLMIQASSYRMELMMCVLTLFSISMLCYIVSDLDSPFSGFFRIDISIIVDVIYRLEVMHKMAALGFEETVCYPDSSRFTQKKYDDAEKVDPAMQIQTVC
ncbi:uncharacterized protein LOC128164042 isoform X1 [Crassostrea angulata]|uniref:uncharacterized protein LOC128164042 isoform X1 n=1 Tax=Magallana angulata TaxID=2784310 RepID=UPI0022B144D4|nr:uncharacterized protein LOC128164042 isoform X1 [Crassostrea angulata]